MPAAVKQRHTRVTKKDIETVRQQLAKEPKPVKPKIEREAPRYKKDFWYGLVYCDSNGWASIVGRTSPEGAFEGVWLGKTDEIIPYLKSKRIDGENVDMVLQAAKEFWSEKKSQSYHLATKGGANHNSIPPQKSYRIILKKDPLFLASLDELISKGYGIPTIQKELKAKGYDVAYATLGRWVKKRRDTIWA
jgi:hypothetical protein